MERAVETKVKKVEGEGQRISRRKTDTIFGLHGEMCEGKDGK